MKKDLELSDYSVVENKRKTFRELVKNSYFSENNNPKTEKSTYKWDEFWNTWLGYVEKVEEVYSGTEIKRKMAKIAFKRAVKKIRLANYWKKVAELKFRINKPFPRDEFAIANEYLGDEVREIYNKADREGKLE
jgi:hypothetical protein